MRDKFFIWLRKWMEGAGKYRWLGASGGIAVVVILIVSLQPSPPSRAARLKDDIEKIAAQQFARDGVDYAVIIQCLRGCTVDFSYGERKQFPAASLIKIPLLLDALEAIQDGTISVDDAVVINKRDITGGSGKLKAKKTPYSLSMEELLEYMIASSDNTAANKLIGRLGLRYCNERFRAFGLEDTVLARNIMDFSMRARGVENYTSARDIAFSLEGLYRNRFFEADLSRVGISFLQKQQVRDRIPRFLPQHIAVAHKTGLERGVVHDAGIVFTDKKDYIICVLVKNEPEYARSKNFIALVSLFTYNLIVDN